MLSTNGAEKSDAEEKYSTLADCPVCDGEGIQRYGGDGTVDDPPDYVLCEFCNGISAVPNYQATYIQKLQSEIERLEVSVWAEQRDGSKKVETEPGTSAGPNENWAPSPQADLAIQAREWAANAVELLEYVLRATVEALGETLGTSDTLKRLVELPRETSLAAQHFVRAETRLAYYKSRDVREAREDLTLAEIEATMAAQAEEKLTGANAAMREVQLKHSLNEDAEVRRMRKRLAEVERDLSDQESAVMAAKSIYKTNVAALNAACHAAELQAAILSVTGKELKQDE